MANGVFVGFEVGKGMGAKEGTAVGIKLGSIVRIWTAVGEGECGFDGGAEGE